MLEITIKKCFIVDELTINDVTKDSDKIIIKDLDNVLFNFENFMKENIQSISSYNYIVIDISDCKFDKVLDSLLRRYFTIHNLSIGTMIIPNKPKEPELSENKSNNCQQKVPKKSKSTNGKKRKNRNNEPYYKQCHIGYNFGNLQHSLGGGWVTK